MAQRTKSGCGFCLPLASGPRDTCAGKRSGRQVIACLAASYSWVIIWYILNRLCCVSLPQKIIVFAGSLPDSSTTFQELREIELYESRAWHLNLLVLRLTRRSSYTDVKLLFILTVNLCYTWGGKDSLKKKWKQRLQSNSDSGRTSTVTKDVSLCSHLCRLHRAILSKPAAGVAFVP